MNKLTDKELVDFGTGSGRVLFSVESEGAFRAIGFRMRLLSKRARERERD
jgi:hypothetical protein